MNKKIILSFHIPVINLIYELNTILRIKNNRVI